MRHELVYLSLMLKTIIMFQQIEDFRYERRYSTRSEATVELIRLGLESLRKEKEGQSE